MEKIRGEVEFCPHILGRLLYRDMRGTLLVDTPPDQGTIYIWWASKNLMRIDCRSCQDRLEVDKLQGLG